RARGRRDPGRVGPPGQKTRTGRRAARRGGRPVPQQRQRVRPVMRRRSMAVAGVAVLAAVLGACSGEPEQPEASPPPEQLDLEREPQPDGDPLPEAPAEDLWLPYQVDQLALVEPPWPAASVQELGGVLLAPAESEGALEFRAVDAEGTTLWWAQRPPSCTGFVLTTTGDGQDLAVLAD